MAERVLMKGNEALGEAAIRAGCLFYYGYPITAQAELLEYMARELPKRGGTFLQTESEIAAIYMVYGTAATGRRVMSASSGPGMSLMAEGISYLTAAQLPAVLERLTQPLYEVPADDGGTKIEDSLMDVVTPFVAHPEPTVSTEPCQRPLGYPPVPTQSLAGLDATPSNPRLDAPTPQGLTASREVIGFVGEQFVRALARAAPRPPDRLDGIDHGFQHHRVVAVGRRDLYRQGDALPLDHNMALRPRLAAIRRIRAGFGAPRGRVRSLSLVSGAKWGCAGLLGSAP